jgi:Deoxynucleotide monophosphate kinase
MDKKIRIAFGSQARIGKDTAVEYLLKKHGGVSFSFASTIYDVLYYTQQKCDFKLEKDREFLQMVGTWARQKNPNVWVNVIIEKIKKIEDSIFISDVRFPNEVEALKKLGFIFVKIERNENEKLLKHESETALLNVKWWDYKIENNASLDEFYEKLDEILIEDTQSLSLDMFHIRPFKPEKILLEEFYWLKFPDYFPCKIENEKMKVYLYELLSTGDIKYLNNILELLQKGLSEELYDVSMIWLQSLDLLFILRSFLGEEGITKLLRTLQILANKDYVKYNLYNEKIVDLLRCLEMNVDENLPVPENYKNHRIFGGRVLFLPDNVTSPFVKK